MIHEIAQFIDYLQDKSPQIFTENLELKPGLYAFVRKSDDKLFIPDEQILEVNKDTENSGLYEQFLERVSNTEMINAMKSFNSGPKVYISIGSPFGIALSGKAYKEKPMNKLYDSAEAYFKAARKFVDENNEKHQQWLADMKQFVESEMYDFLEKHVDVNKLNDNYMFYFFLEEPGLEDYKEIQNRFLAQKLFNTEKYNIKGKDGTIYGISDDVSGFNEKKEFLKHHTGPMEVNYRVSEATARKLYQFFRLQQKNKILPNPMPIFVDQNELTKETVTFYNGNNKLGHKEIIEHLLEYNKKILGSERKEVLQNFYLIFFHNGLKGNRIQDLDFVPVFRYKTDDMPKIRGLFQITNKENKKVFSDSNIDNIFEFQNNVLNVAYNGQLIRSTKNGVWLRYFDDMEHKPEYGATEAIVNLFYKYRKALYDYVYKSRTQAITHNMFYDIMATSVLDDIIQDEERNKDYSIKQKLNIWFSFYNYFNQNKKINMVNKTEEIHEKLKHMGNNPQERLEDDAEFAFASGQLIRQILNKSESAERTHALLEPFLQKSDAKMFKLEIARAFETYKHAFTFYRGDKRYAFDHIMSEVMGFEPDEKNIKNLLPFILAGYFAETVFKKESNNEDEQ